MSFEELVEEAVRKAIRAEVPSLVRSAMAGATSSSSDYLTPAQAAKVAKVHVDTVRLWLKSGDLPANHHAGKRKRVLRSDLDRFLASGPSEDESPSAENIAAAALARRRKTP